MNDYSDELTTPNDIRNNVRIIIGTVVVFGIMGLITFIF